MANDFNRDKKMRLLLICLSLMAGPVALAQQRVAEPPRCHAREMVLYGIAKETDPDRLIIVVARLGEGENRPNLNRRRLHNVRTYWTEFLKEYLRKRETIILAEGERVKDYGRLEFYVDGKLMATLRLNRNSDLGVIDCSRAHDDPPCPSYERNFYPCRDRYSRRRKNH
jgi:hypothetical protein